MLSQFSADTRRSPRAELPTELEAMEREARAASAPQERPAAAWCWATKAVSWCASNSRTAGLALLAGCIIELLLIAADASSGLVVPIALLLTFAAGAIGCTVVCAKCLDKAKDNLHALRVAKNSGSRSDLPEAVSCGISVIDSLYSLAADIGFPRGALGNLTEEYEMLRERYELVTTNIAASVIMYGNDGSVEFFSPYTQVLSGLGADELDSLKERGEDMLEALVVEEDLERYRRARAVSRLGEEMLVRYRIRHKSGLRLWLETQMVPVSDDDGEVTSVMSVTIDVTDSLSYQEQIEEQNRDLSDFAYMVSHDLKAPIFTIKGMAAALLEDHGEKLGEGREMIEYIVDGARRLESLVATVIEYCSISTRDVQETEVDLNRVFEHVRADLGELIKTKGADLQISSNCQPLIRGDAIRLYQVFSNLFGNALKYSSKERAPEIRVIVQKTEGNTISVSIQDNGLGIPEDRIGDIFRPYQRAHGNEIEGSGIGLACVKKILDRMGGTVSVDSLVGKGSTFTVTLPAVPTGGREVPADLARLF